MGHRYPVPDWIEYWLLASAVICAIDVSFTMLRPMSTPGGSLETVYYLWNIYAKVDIRYLDANDIVTMATGRLMTVEILMDLIAYYLSRMRSRHAILLTFTTSAFVFWKTALFLMLYINPPPGNPSYFVEGTPVWKIAIVFWFMNGIWMVMPFAVMLTLWNKLALPVQQVTRRHSGEKAESLVC